MPSRTQNEDVIMKNPYQTKTLLSGLLPVWQIRILASIYILTFTYSLMHYQMKWNLLLTQF